MVTFCPSTGSYAPAVDGTVMDEHVLAALALNETKTLLVIEPFHGTGNQPTRHKTLIQHIDANRSRRYQNPLHRETGRNSGLRRATTHTDPSAPEAFGGSSAPSPSRPASQGGRTGHNPERLFKPRAKGSCACLYRLATGWYRTTCLPRNTTLWVLRGIGRRSAGYPPHCTEDAPASPRVRTPSPSLRPSRPPGQTRHRPGGPVPASVLYSIVESPGHPNLRPFMHAWGSMRSAYPPSARRSRPSSVCRPTSWWPSFLRLRQQLRRVQREQPSTPRRSSKRYAPPGQGHRPGRQGPAPLFGLTGGTLSAPRRPAPTGAGGRHRTPAGSRRQPHPKPSSRGRHT